MLVPRRACIRINIHVIVGRFYYTMTDDLYIHCMHACDNCIFTYINATKINRSCIGKYTVHPMDGMGTCTQV